MIDDPRGFLTDLFETAVAAVQARQCMDGSLPHPPAGRTVVVGAGKAAAAMAAVVEAQWQGDLSGLVVVPYGHDAATRRIEVVQAAHPVPDASGTAAAARILETVAGLQHDDLAICLFSGGGSALLALPADGVALEDKQAVTRALLRSGATIREINCVRKHLSAIKGGRLAAAAAPARIATLAISDVPGDDLPVIASGPTVADPGTRQDALALLDRYDVDAPDPVRARLGDPASETPKPGDPVFERCENVILAAARDALAAAAAAASRQGVTPVILGDAIEGEARDVARDHAALVREIAGGRGTSDAPAVILSGGETTVTWRGDGSGGRNQEFLLALAIELDAMAGVHALACDTDGIDGSSAAAGAIIDPTTPARAARSGRPPHDALARQDSGGFFAALDDAVVTGPTRTNVNDFRAILLT